MKICKVEVVECSSVSSINTKLEERLIEGWELLAPAQLAISGRSGSRFYTATLVKYKQESEI